MKTNIFIIHDGITNSIFYSQILKPFKNKALQNPNNKFMLISFETSNPKIQLDLPNNLTIKILKKSLFQSINKFRLKKILLSPSNIVARGPIAGWLALKTGFKSVTVQARGILTEEYQLTHSEDTGVKKILTKLRAAYYRNIERYVYSNQQIKIEAVSGALKQFLHTKYNANLNNISIANLDIPQTIEPAQLVKWKQEVRTSLGFKSDDHIICYSGSIRPWQHPKDIIPFLKNKLAEQPNTKLLILTQGQKEFKKFLDKEKVDKNNYKITTSKPTEIYKYLAAANIGAIYRNKHIVNWVSRPTKALEYKAAGLKVIHNGTVDFLNKLF
jgi:hypothetical protein